MQQEPRLVSPREQSLTRYFRRLPIPPTHTRALRRSTIGAVLGSAGLLIILLSTWTQGGGVTGLFLLGGSTAFIFLGVREYLQEKYRHEKSLVATFPQPPDSEVDQWFSEALEHLEKYSLEKLELTSDDVQEAAALCPIIGPVLWMEGGAPREDLVSKSGQDGFARYGVYQISFLWLTEDSLGIFRCDYNFIRDAVLNEETHEFYYQDIVSVSTHEEASSLTLASGSSLTSVQEFRISVTGDRYFTMTVGSDQLKKLTGAERVPENGTDHVIRALRTKLKEKKGALLGT